MYNPFKDVFPLCSDHSYLCLSRKTKCISSTVNNNISATCLPTCKRNHTVSHWWTYFMKQNMDYKWCC